MSCSKTQNGCVKTLRLGVNTLAVSTPPETGVNLRLTPLGSGVNTRCINDCVNVKAQALAVGGWTAASAWRCPPVHLVVDEEQVDLAQFLDLEARVRDWPGGSRAGGG